MFAGAHPQILAAQRDHPDVRFGASGTLYHLFAYRTTGFFPYWEFAAAFAILFAIIIWGLYVVAKPRDL